MNRFEAGGMTMKSATQSPAGDGPEQVRNHSGFFSSEAVLEILKLILAGSALAEVLTIIARLVESQGDGTLCTIWLPDDDGKQLYCAAAPSLPGFHARRGGCLSVRKADPAAQPFIGESRYM